MEQKQYTRQQRDRQRAEDRQREERAFYRILFLFGMAALGIVILRLVMRFYVNFAASELGVANLIDGLLTVFSWAFLAAALLSVGYDLIQWRRGGGSARARTVATWSGLACFLCFVITNLYGEGIQMLYMGVPLLAVLGLFYYIYPRDFFAVSLLSLYGVFALWLLRSALHYAAFPLWGWILLGVSFAVAALGCAACLLLKKGGGVLWLAGHARRFFPANAKYSLCLITCALLACLLLCALLLGATMAFYALFVVAAWVFVLAVYYTIQLM